MWFHVVPSVVPSEGVRPMWFQVMGQVSLQVGFQVWFQVWLLQMRFQLWCPCVVLWCPNVVPLCVAVIDMQEGAGRGVRVYDKIPYDFTQTFLDVDISFTLLVGCRRS